MNFFFSYPRGVACVVSATRARQAIPPTGTIAYYQAIQDRMGGLTATQQFARLYMFPGVLHCGGGTAPNTFDLLTPLMNWVENGAAPTKVVATQRTGDTIVRTRPVFPYPLVARHTGTGTGSTNDATNCTAAPPEHPTQDRFPWLGRFEGPHR